MVRLVTVIASLSLCLAYGASGTHAQNLAVPIIDDCVSDGHIACWATSRVAGLNPRGDGFLAVRTGPGTKYRMIDKLYNGDVVETMKRRGSWVGVRYRNGRKGWVHSRWLRDLAG